MCSSCQSQPWVRQYARNCSNCCSMVWVCACRWVDTRTYIAILIGFLLSHSGRSSAVACLLLKRSSTPLDERVLGSIPLLLGVTCLNGVTPDDPWTFLHVYPPDGNNAFRLHQKDTLFQF